ncbi:MAG: hypothetical protein PHC86_08950 [Eubacteriales bacterium]|nr:hypothetical protein [Eubacteriales bacterium]
MVRGIQFFKDYFAGYEDQYAIIGGTACDLLFGEAGLTFRATRDLDIVLIVEMLEPKFAEENLGLYTSRSLRPTFKEYRWTAILSFLGSIG